MERALCTSGSSPDIDPRTLQVPLACLTIERRPLVEGHAGARERWLEGAASLATDVLLGAPAVPATALAQDPSASDPGYAWQHGIYWLASNLAAESPLVLVLDDLQRCDAPSARALAFVARRLEGQQLGAILATRWREVHSKLAPFVVVQIAAGRQLAPSIEIARHRRRSLTTPEAMRTWEGPGGISRSLRGA
jgi:hypothetical protein